MTRQPHLAFVSTHPIQYHSAWYRALAAHPDLRIHVYYCHKATPQEQAGAGFGVEFEWDVPLLTGYPHSFLQNIANPPGHGRFAGFDTPEIKDIIRRREYDAVLVNGWHYKSAWQAIWACWKSGVKVLVRGDSHLHTPRGPLKKLAKSLVYRRFIPRFDACLAVGQWSREYFLYYGARPERIFFVPHAVDNQRIAAECRRWEPTHSQLRSQWGLDEKTVVFAFAGKFIEKKRPMDFVRAIDRAARQGAAVQGLMVGDGPLRAGCEDFVRAHRSAIRFTGFLNQSQIVAAYVASDLLVLPSDGGETWGLVVNEAMACGRPCIVSDHVGSGPDLIEVGRTGAIFPLGDVDALAALMTGLARDPSHLAVMSAQARRRMQKYSVQAAVEGVLQCLADITGSRALVCNC
jgi:glycosyltransferase involved in cell wall biosynthesis